MARKITDPKEKIERISEIFSKLDIFYHLRERNDQGYLDLPGDEGREMIEELEDLVTP
jgi:hypothetical protein